MGRTNQKGRNKGSEPFTQIINSMTREPAWKSLPFGARSLYWLLKGFYNGQNNGQIYMSVRKAAEELNASRSSVERWFQDLQDCGFIEKTGGGFLGIDGRGTATYWRLTEIGCMGQQPTRDYKNWQPSKNKTPSRKSGRTVTIIGTPCHDNRDGCHDNRDGFDPKSPSDCPDKQDISTCHYEGDDREKPEQPDQRPEALAAIAGRSQERAHNAIRARLDRDGLYGAAVEHLDLGAWQAAEAAEARERGAGAPLIVEALREVAGR